MSCTTPSETTRTSRGGCCVSCSSERPREGERTRFREAGAGEGERVGCLPGTSRIITTWCLSLSTWWRSNRSWRWRSMTTWSSSPATFSFCLTTQKHTTRLKTNNTNKRKKSLFTRVWTCVSCLCPAGQSWVQGGLQTLGPVPAHQEWVCPARGIWRGWWRRVQLARQSRRLCWGRGESTGLHGWWKKWEEFTITFSLCSAPWWWPLRLLLTPERSHLPEGDPGAAPRRRGVVHRTNRPSGQRAVPETPLQDGTCQIRVASDNVYPGSTSTACIFIVCLCVCVCLRAAIPGLLRHHQGTHRSENHRTKDPG